MKWKRKKQRGLKRIATEQKQYKKLRNKGHEELDMLEEYFGNSYSDSYSTYKSILFHLQAQQKEKSYFGLLGVVIGILVAIFSFGFTLFISISQVGIIDDPILISGISILIFLFVISGYRADKKRRNQLYINEYMIALVKEKMALLND
ncbi:hypothetical protein ACERII_05805 [Evansella sp. AB-rgal1]|uniref:hypothetical protein n=1 Tax=Evansella sp. AB-rgal1 TaxID=3242696 RepID=UPI00359E2E3C